MSKRRWTYQLDDPRVRGVNLPHSSGEDIARLHALVEQGNVVLVSAGARFSREGSAAVGQIAVGHLPGTPYGVACWAPHNAHRQWGAYATLSEAFAVARRLADGSIGDGPLPAPDVPLPFEEGVELSGDSGELAPPADEDLPEPASDEGETDAGPAPVGVALPFEGEPEHWVCDNCHGAFTHDPLQAPDGRLLGLCYCKPECLAHRLALADAAAAALARLQIEGEEGPPLEQDETAATPLPTVLQDNDRMGSADGAEGPDTDTWSDGDQAAAPADAGSGKLPDVAEKREARRRSLPGCLDGVAVGANIARLRAEAKMEQSDLARAVSMAPAQLGALERGETTNPRIELCQKLADALGVGVEQIAGVAV